MYFRPSCDHHPGCAAGMGCVVCLVMETKLVVIGVILRQPSCKHICSNNKLYFFKLPNIFVSVLKYICMNQKNIFVQIGGDWCDQRATCYRAKKPPTSSTLQLLDEPAPGAGGRRWVTKFNIGSIFLFRAFQPTHLV